MISLNGVQKQISELLQKRAAEPVAKITTMIIEFPDNTIEIWRLVNGRFELVANE